MIGWLSRCILDGLGYSGEGPSIKHWPVVMLVVIPDTVEQVQQIMRICHDHTVPVVARGAGTGLCAGAMPHPEGVVLSLARFNRIVDVDTLARTAKVEPGVRNVSISEAAAPHGLYYPPHPSLGYELEYTFEEALYARAYARDLLYFNPKRYYPEWGEGETGATHETFPQRSRDLLGAWAHYISTDLN